MHACIALCCYLQAKDRPELRPIMKPTSCGQPMMRSDRNGLKTLEKSCTPHLEVVGITCISNENFRIIIVTFILYDL